MSGEPLPGLYSNSIDGSADAQTISKYSFGFVVVAKKFHAATTFWALAWTEMAVSLAG